MRRLILLVAVSCGGGAIEPAVDAAPRVCDEIALRGCDEANESNPGSCTWCAPVGEACTAAVTPFCSGGLGWCTDGACRAWCDPAGADCAAGEVVHRVRGAGRDLCVCVPE